MVNSLTWTLGMLPSPFFTHRPYSYGCCGSCGVTSPGVNIVTFDLSCLCCAPLPPPTDRIGLPVSIPPQWGTGGVISLPLSRLCMYAVNQHGDRKGPPGPTQPHSPLLCTSFAAPT